MLKVIQSPAKYLQGPDASTLFGQYAKNLLSVSYQNKKTNEFFVHASPYSYCIAPVPPVCSDSIRPNSLTPGLTM